MTGISPERIGMTSNEAAAHWLVRIDRGTMSALDEGTFRAWLEDPVNAAEFASARDALAAFDDSELDPDLIALRRSALRSSPARSIRWLPAAAVLVLTVIGSTLLLQNNVPNPQFSTEIRSAPAVASAGYATQRGEQRLLRLSDGSLIRLNTDTALRIAYSPAERLITLAKGQALFTVAHDGRRPFVVEAAGRRVMAVGTVFEVRVDPDRFKVLLIEGKVKVSRTRVDIGPDKATMLIPGQELVAEIGIVERVQSSDTKSELLWTDGYVELNDEPLGAAVEELNRYSERQIRVRDSETAALRVSGVFRTDDPERFAANARDVLPVKVTQSPSGEIEISRE